MREVKRDEFVLFIAERGFGAESRPGMRPGSGHSWMQYFDESGNLLAQANYFKDSPHARLRRQYLVSES